MYKYTKNDEKVFPHEFKANSKLTDTTLLQRIHTYIHIYIYICIRQHKPSKMSMHVCMYVYMTKYAWVPTLYSGYMYISM